MDKVQFIHEAWDYAEKVLKMKQQFIPLDIAIRLYVKKFEDEVEELKKELRELKEKDDTL